MSKLAHAVVDETSSEKAQETLSDSDQLYLKLQKEAEIRMKLDEFARELAHAALEREEKQ